VVLAVMMASVATECFIRLGDPGFYLRNFGPGRRIIRNNYRKSVTKSNRRCKIIA